MVREMTVFWTQETIADSKTHYASPTVGHDWSRVLGPVNWLRQERETSIVDVHRGAKLRGVCIHGPPDRDKENRKTVTALTIGACARQTERMEERKETETKPREATRETGAVVHAIPHHSVISISNNIRSPETPATAIS
jgi:hypothetical protein